MTERRSSEGVRLDRIRQLASEIAALDDDGVRRDRIVVLDVPDPDRRLVLLDFQKTPPTERTRAEVVTEDDDAGVMRDEIQQDAVGVWSLMRSLCRIDGLRTIRLRR